MAEYYIEVDTYWANSRSYFVGPFQTRVEAEQWYQNDGSPSDNVWLSTSNCGGNIKTAWRIYPYSLSTTQAKKRGMKRNTIIPISTYPSAASIEESIDLIVDYIKLVY